MKDMHKPRLFYVVESDKSKKQIFDNNLDAIDLMNKLHIALERRVIMSVYEVKNYFLEEDGGYTYEDLSDTFKFISHV